MPELPEVQTVVNDLKAAGLIGAVIVRAKVFWPRSICGGTGASFCRLVRGHRLSAIRRRGKFIIFTLSGGRYLLAHMRMTGRFIFCAPERVRSKHEHVVMTLNGHRQLRFHDTRKFGRFYLVDDPATILGRLGPEPLSPDFSPSVLARRMFNRKRMIKPLLLDQAFIAGIGNIYADEALWEACIHPRQVAADIGEHQINTLYHAIRKVLRRGLKNLGTTLGGAQNNFFSIKGRTGHNREQLKVFRRTDSACPRCQTTIERIVVAQRGSHICAKCQKI